MKRYEGDGITITWDAERCIHTEECVRGLPGVFDGSKRPWIDATGGTADEIAAVIDRCPSGALGYERPGVAVTVEPHQRDVSISVQESGPLFVRGSVRMTDADGSALEAPERMALCRCGASSKKPFCDNTHKKIGFTG